MSVAERVRMRWPQTEAELLGDPALGYDAAKTQAIADAVGQVYHIVSPLPTPTDVDDHDAMLQQEVADRAVLALIPFAKDVIARGTLQRTLDTPNATAGSTRYYDKPAILDGIATQIRSDMAERAGVLADLLGAFTSSTPRATRMLPFMVAASPRRPR